MRLIQIPFSHNCIKVRRALEVKGLGFETESIPPADRRAVFRASGQGLVPVLVDGERVLADSTRILLYLEERYPERPLLPAAGAPRAECLVLEDWADAAFMALTRRLAYWNVLSRPGTVEKLFFPDARGLSRAIRGRVARRIVRRRFRISDARHVVDVEEARRVSALAAARLAGAQFLVGERMTIADLALAAMSAPMWAAPEVRDDPAVRALLEWGRPIVGEDVVASYLR